MDMDSIPVLEPQGFVPFLDDAIVMGQTIEQYLDYLGVGGYACSTVSAWCRNLSVSIFW